MGKRNDVCLSPLDAHACSRDPSSRSVDSLCPASAKAVAPRLESLGSLVLQLQFLWILWLFTRFALLIIDAGRFWCCNPSIGQLIGFQSSILRRWRTNLTLTKPSVGLSCKSEIFLESASTLLTLPPS